MHIVIEDGIRGGRHPVEVDDDHTVAITVGRLVELFGLPHRTLDKRRLTYELARPTDEDDIEPFDPDARIGDLTLVDGEPLVLSPRRLTGLGRGQRSGRRDRGRAPDPRRPVA